MKSSLNEKLLGDVEAQKQQLAIENNVPKTKSAQPAAKKDPLA